MDNIRNIKCKPEGVIQQLPQVQVHCQILPSAQGEKTECLQSAVAKSYSKYSLFCKQWHELYTRSVHPAWPHYKLWIILRWKSSRINLASTNKRKIRRCLMPSLLPTAQHTSLYSTAIASIPVFQTGVHLQQLCASVEALSWRGGP